MLASKEQLIAAMKPDEKSPSGRLATREQLMAAMKPSGQSEQPQSLGGEVWQGAKDIVGGLGRGALDIPSSMIESSPIPKIIRSLGQATQSPATTAMANPLEALGQHLPGNQSDVLYNVGRFGPAIAGGVRGAYEVGKLGASGLKGGNALLSRMLGTNADEKATDLARIISENKNTRGIKADLAEHVRVEHATEKAHAAERFDKTFKEAEYKGYAEDASQSPKKLSLKNFSTDMEKLPLDADREIHGYKVAERLDNFKENPTFKNAHLLQSRLGNIERKLSSSPDQILKDKAIAVRKVKNSLLKDIEGSFKKNGHSNLWDKYSSDRAHYRDNVGIFHKDNVISKTVGGAGKESEQNPSGLVNALMQDKPSVNAVVDKLPSYVKDKMGLLKMKGAFSKVEGKDIQATAKSLLDKYNKLGTLDFDTSILSPHFKRSIDEIEHSLARANKLKKSPGKIKSLGLGAAALGGLGYSAEKLYDLLG